MAVGRPAENFEETALLARVDHFLDADFSLHYFQVISLFNLLFHIEDGAASDSVHDAGVVWRRQQFHPAEARLLQHEHVQHSALLDVVVEQPKHIVKAIRFRVRNVRH